LYWVFHGLPWSQVWSSFERVRWGWLPAAIGLELLVYFGASWEWQLLVRPAGRISLGQATQALFAGRFANDVLPLHAGYLLRLYLVSRWLEREVATVIPSLVIERLFDSLWLALCIGATVFFFPLPTNLSRVGAGLGAAIVGGAVLVLWLSLRESRPGAAGRRRRTWRWKPLRKAADFCERIANGLRSIGRSYILWTAFALSALKLILTALGFLFLLWSYGFAFPLVISLGVFLMAYVGISMPSTPASIGVFQLFCVEGLRFFGVAKPVASGFALLAFVAWTVPLTIGGFIALAQSGITWRQLRQRSEWKHP
jgi:uncharacterized protein (TIRG00374 family)